MGQKAAGSDLATGGRAENTGRLLGGAAEAHRTTGKMFWAISTLRKAMDEKLMSASRGGRVDIVPQGESHIEVRILEGEGHKLPWTKLRFSARSLYEDHE